MIQEPVCDTICITGTYWICWWVVRLVWYRYIGAAGHTAVSCV